MPLIGRIKSERSSLVRRHAQPADLPGAAQVATTLSALALLWFVAARANGAYAWCLAVAIPLIGLFTLRSFALMHECGHCSVFRTPSLNRISGFVLGVIVGMPQFVWSQNHQFHHAHNGDWERYRGPLTTASVAEFAAMSPGQQLRYQRRRSLLLAPLGGLAYLVVNPRITWLRGCWSFLVHITRHWAQAPTAPLRRHAATFRTQRWNSRREFWDMTWNNLVLLTLWVLMCQAAGPLRFFGVYLAALALAGGAGIVLFTVQHNFEHSYASASSAWDPIAGAVRGTSYLVLPPWLNWITVNIAYHHIHHLSSRIPNYRLARCHEENQDLFSQVVRLRLWQIPGALKCILWDEAARRIISVAEYRRLVHQTALSPQDL